MFFSKKKCSTFGSHFYTLVIVLLCIFWLKLSNKGSIFLHLKVLHDTLFSYVFYYLVKYCVFGRTNCNACYRNACYRLFHCLLKKFNLHYWFCSSIINLSTVLDYSVNKFVANLLVWGQSWNEVKGFFCLSTERNACYRSSQHYLIHMSWSFAFLWTWGSSLR